MVSASALQQLEDDRGHLPCGLLGVMSVFLQFISESCTTFHGEYIVIHIAKCT